MDAEPSSLHSDISSKSYNSTNSLPTPFYPLKAPWRQAWPRTLSALEIAVSSTRASH